MKLLLVVPPLLQFNCPYPSTGYLLNYLVEKGFDVEQADWSLELVLKIFSHDGLSRITKKIKKSNESAKFFLHYQDQYVASIDKVIKFLQNSNDEKLAKKINSRKFIPEGSRFNHLYQYDNFLDNNFSPADTISRAKYLASLYIDDISDVISSNIDINFGLARYGDKLAASATSFNALLKRLKTTTLIDELYEEVIQESLKSVQADIVGFSTPFPGNIYGALKGSQIVKKIFSNVISVMGGGYVNTELKYLNDPRFFNYIDYLIFDDGEKPLEILLNNLSGKNEQTDLLRTWKIENKKIVKSQNGTKADVNFKNLNGPSYQGLEFNRYISMIEYPNLMTRYWTDFKWNKLIIAHGCYWKKCTFCDISLDYINRYEPANARKIVDQMERLIQETGVSDFHLVDEAAPPMVLKAMSKEIIAREIKIQWWGNIRFDEAFTLDVTQNLAKSGLTAVSGGLEVASPRVLNLISKGVTIEQVAKVTKNFRDANILVHAYLMYGFPTQTLQETIDSLEIVRQLFLNQCLTSAYWHRFSVTAHSPVGMNPQKYDIEIVSEKIPKEGIFARNDLKYRELQNKTKHDQLGIGLKKALYNYQLGIGLDYPLQDWFDFKIVKTSISKNYIVKIIS